MQLFAARQRASHLRTEMTSRVWDWWPWKATAGGKRMVVNAFTVIVTAVGASQARARRFRAFNRVTVDGVSLGEVGWRADDPTSRPGH